MEEERKQELIDRLLAQNLDGTDITQLSTQLEEDATFRARVNKEVILFKAIRNVQPDKVEDASDAPVDVGADIGVMEIPIVRLPYLSGMAYAFKGLSPAAAPGEDRLVHQEYIRQGRQYVFFTVIGLINLAVLLYLFFIA